MKKETKQPRNFIVCRSPTYKNKTSMRTKHPFSYQEAMKHARSDKEIYKDFQQASQELDKLMNKYEKRNKTKNRK